MFPSVKASVCISVFQPSLALLYRTTAGIKIVLNFACAKGSKLQPHPKSPKSPRLEDQHLEYLEYSKCFQHGRREGLAPLAPGDRNYFCHAVATERLHCQLPILLAMPAEA